jgi:hypothetical protein
MQRACDDDNEPPLAEIPHENATTPRLETQPRIAVAASVAPSIGEPISWCASSLTVIKRH